MIDFLQEHPINCAVLKERKWNEDRELRRAAKKDTRNFGFHLRVVQVGQLLHQGRRHFAGLAIRTGRTRSCTYPTRSYSAVMIAFTRSTVTTKLAS